MSEPDFYVIQIPPQFGFSFAEVLLAAFILSSTVPQNMSRILDLCQEYKFVICLRSMLLDPSQGRLPLTDLFTYPGDFNSSNDSETKGFYNSRLAPSDLPVVSSQQIKK